jgi:hypothetical protein
VSYRRRKSALLYHEQKCCAILGSVEVSPLSLRVWSGKRSPNPLEGTYIIALPTTLGREMQKNIGQ